MPFVSWSAWLPRSERDEAWGLFGSSAGSVELPAGGSPSSHDRGLLDPVADPSSHGRLWREGRIFEDFLLILIARGEGSFESATLSSTLEAGDLVCVAPGTRHRCLPDPVNGWLQYWVSFDGEFARSLAQRGFLVGEGFRVQKIGPSPLMLGMFADLIDLAREERPGWQQMLGAQILRIVAYAGQATEAQALDPRIRSLVELVKAEFQAHIYDSLDVEDLARRLGQNYKSFREDFKSYTGLSPYQYFLHMKIDKAKELLAERGTSVKEVSYRLAFQNPYYFSRLFKKKTGTSPSQWNGLEIPEN